MIFKNSNTIVFAAAAALALLGCGSSSKPSTTQNVVASQGATIKAGAATLTIPAGALAQDTQVTLREAEVRHTGRSVRVEVEPHGQALAVPAKLSIKVDDSNIKHIKMLDDNGGMNSVEPEDRNHREFKTGMSKLGEVEVEVEHGVACTQTCSATEECDDGACKPHDERAATCSTMCDLGQECDDGACKTHNEFESGHGGTAGSCTPACDPLQECDNGTCKAHGSTP